MKLDDKNMHIIRILQQDGRISNHALAERVALSPSACLSRVRYLEKNGYIDGYRTRINLAKLGPTLVAFMEVTLEHHYLKDFQRFDHYIKQQPEIVESFVVGAHFDYLLQVVVCDMSQLKRLSDSLLDAKLSIAKLHTIPVIDTNKSFCGYPLDLIANNNRS
jgi:Lrp/AsnC family transcriptional regulator, leucine-responsive regulatory protein